MYALDITGFQQEFVFVVSYQGFRSTVPSPLGISNVSDLVRTLAAMLSD